MKKNGYWVLMACLILANIILTTSSVGLGPAIISGYKPTYTPNGNYITPDPVQVGKFNGVTPAKLSSQGGIQTSEEDEMPASSSAQIEVGFGIVGDSNEPLIGAQLAGFDGSSNSFKQFADGNGNLAITGFPGNWQFTAYAPGYFSKTLNRQLSYSTYVVLILQKIDTQQNLNLSTHEEKFLATESMDLDDCELDNAIQDSSIDDNSSMDDPWPDGFDEDFLL